MPQVPPATDVIGAVQPGSTFPARSDTRLAGGIVVPGHVLRDVPDMAVARLAGIIHTNTDNATPMRAPNAGALIKRVVAAVEKPAPSMGPSVIGTVYNATPLSNVTEVLAALRQGNLPLVPLGLRERVASAMPPGMRARSAAFARQLARIQSSRPSGGNRIPRE